MQALQVREALKNLSEDELDNLAGALGQAPELNGPGRAAVLAAISQEQAARRGEGLGRKLERFWNRHGQTVGAVALGALLGDWLGD